MKVNENPLKLLNLSNSASGKEIYELCKKKSLLTNSEKYNDYEKILNDMSRRLEAEVNWLPELNIEEITTILKNKVIKKEHNIIVRINISRLKLDEVDSCEELSDITKQLDELCMELNDTNINGIAKLINEDRSEGGFALINDIEKLEEQLNNVIESVVEEIKDKLFQYSTREIYKFFKKVLSVEGQKAEKMSFGIVVRKLIEKHREKYSIKIEQYQDRIIQEIDSIINKNEIENQLNEVFKNMQTWYEYAYPLIILQENISNRKNAYIDVEILYIRFVRLINTNKDKGEYQLVNQIENTIYEFFKDISDYKNNLEIDMMYTGIIPNVSKKQVVKNSKENKVTSSDYVYIILTIIIIIIFFPILVRIGENLYPDNVTTSNTSTTTTKKPKLEKELTTLKQQIEKLEIELQEINKKLDNIENDFDLDDDIGAVSLYNSYVSEYDKKYQDYSLKVDTYNAKVKEYNSMN